MLDDQWKGEFDFDGVAVQTMNRKQRADLARRRIGMVFQSYHLLDDLTVAENIDLPLSYKDIPKFERQALVADTLDRFNIVGKKDLYPGQLSGGQQQLVGIARAVIHRPSLLLADEPTGNLQSAQAKEIMELFRHVESSRARRSCRSRTRRPMPSMERAPSNCVTDGCTPTLPQVQRRSIREKVCFLFWPASSLVALLATFAGSHRRLHQRQRLRLDIPHSNNPIDTYRATLVPQPKPCELSANRCAGTRRRSRIVLKDAIALALENNLDLAIARYNIPIAQADILRTQAGGTFRGVNTGVVQNTPGGGVGGFGSSSAGAGAGGTSGGAGGAGSGASGLVQSTLGTGTNVASYDPALTGSFNNEHFTQPLSNTSIYGTQTLQQNTTNGNIEYSQAFPTGTSLSAIFDNSRGATNSPNSFLNPTLNSYYHIALQQQLLAGFGFGPNLRFLRIAKNNQKISDAGL